MDAPTSPTGGRIVIRLIERDELDRIVRRCWPQRAAIERLFEDQGTIGLAAWDGDRCVAQLHGYALTLPDGENPLWPHWNRPWWATRDERPAIGIRGRAWCHACMHVGRTLETDLEEHRAFVRRIAKQQDWDVDRTVATMNGFDGVFVTHEEIAGTIARLRETGQTEFHTLDHGYHGRGIGTALATASVAYAHEHGYDAVAATGAPADFITFANEAGHLPWTTYRKLGFDVAGYERKEGELPGWVEHVVPHLRPQLDAALAAGRSPRDLQERWMVLTL